MKSILANETAKIGQLCDCERGKNKKNSRGSRARVCGIDYGGGHRDCEVDGNSPYFVIGVDLPAPGSFWKIPLINAGQSPFQAGDPNVKKTFSSAVNIKKNLVATWVPEAYREADIIIVDINLDVLKPEIGKAKESKVDLSSFKRAIEDIGKRMNPRALLLVETTVPRAHWSISSSRLLKNAF